MINKFFRFVSGVWIALLVLAGAAAQAQEWRESSITINGVERWYRVYIPAALPPHAPVLLSLHGGGSMYTVDKGATHGWVRLTDLQRFLLVVPNVTSKDGDSHSKRQLWNDLRSGPIKSQSTADDVSFIRAAIT